MSSTEAVATAVNDIYELTQDYSAELQMRLSYYALEHRLRLDRLLRVDLVLMLLRINTPEALERATELTGCSISRLPAAMPLWPPKPVERAPSPPRIIWRRPDNPCLDGTDMAAHFDQVKVGMTKEQALGRGVTLRDLRYWTKKGWIIVELEVKS